jgi:hypothetical protein
MDKALTPKCSKKRILKMACIAGFYEQTSDCKVAWSKQCDKDWRNFAKRQCDKDWQNFAKRAKTGINLWRLFHKTFTFQVDHQNFLLLLAIFPKTIWSHWKLRQFPLCLQIEGAGSIWTKRKMIPLDWPCNSFVGTYMPCVVMPKSFFPLQNISGHCYCITFSTVKSRQKFVLIL